VLKFEHICFKCLVHIFKNQTVLKDVTHVLHNTLCSNFLFADLVSLLNFSDLILFKIVCTLAQ